MAPTLVLAPPKTKAETESLIQSCQASYLYLNIKNAAFEATHKDLMEESPIHDEILLDALALSKEFSTRVLCVYSNDEACDFAVTAENGQLIRLRFKAGREQGKYISNDVAQQTQTEIQATRILMDGEEPDPNAVFEYTAFEAIQTQDTPLKLYPYWVYHEGEIDGQVVFYSVKSIPADIRPDVLFRNVFLEFEEAFGKAAPDFTNIPEENRYERIAFQAPPTPSLIAKAFNLPISLLALITSSRKALLWTAGIIFVLCAGLFGDREERPKESIRFAEYCVKAGGNPTRDSDKKCSLNNKIYSNWNLPGAKDERRVMILTVGKQKRPCSDNSEKMCLVVNDEIFPFEIEGFTFEQDKFQVVPVVRVQLCDPELDNNCSQITETFTFRALLRQGK